MRPEILAPAGSYDSAVAAVRCGADAVYMGGKGFNARRNAENFDDDALEKAISYCTLSGVKVYVTVNTLVSDDEIESAVDEIRKARAAGAGAIIIQDIGLACIAGRLFPDLPLHASTQMSVQSIYGINLLSRFGYKRAVLPRELSAEEIRFITSHSDMPAEIFVHGAHCMCLSGQCLMSSTFGRRSGNRGLCAQPCRLPFGVNGKGGHALSLKDLSLIGRIKETEDAGVASLKIEGRMKRPEYVAAAVTACRNALDGKRDTGTEKLLAGVFSRSGFTSGYFDGKIDGTMFGIRTKDDVENAGEALPSLTKLYEKERAVFPLDMIFRLNSHEASLTASAAGYTVAAVSGEAPSPAVNKAVSADDAVSRLSKLGGTRYFPGRIECEFEDGLFISAGAINALRRDAIALIEKEMLSRNLPPERNDIPELVNHERGEKQLHLRFFTPSQIPEDTGGAARVIVPLETDAEAVRRLAGKGVRVSAEIPVNFFSNGEYYKSRLLALREAGAGDAWCCGLDGIELAKECGVPFSCGFGMNIFNSYSAQLVSQLGTADILLSSELSAAECGRIISPVPTGVAVYGRLPLMVTRACPVRSRISCGECGGKSFLEDRLGVKFPVRCRNGCSFIFNSVPLCTYDKSDEISADYELMYFTTETREECEKLISDYKKRETPGEFTRGAFSKRVL